MSGRWFVFTHHSSLITHHSSLIMIIEATAPTRVDLAGGTIDIWPLYLFHPGATTVNFAVSMRARCRIELRRDDRIILESRDRKVSFESSLSEIEALAHEERLELRSEERRVGKECRSWWSTYQ